MSCLTVVYTTAYAGCNACHYTHAHIYTQEDGIVIEYYDLVCEGPLDIVWIIVIYAYIVLTQLLAFFLAFRTRKVTIKALNDSKYLSALIYVSTGILIIMVVCAVLLDKYLNTDAAVFSGLLFIYTTLVLSLMFIPKVRFLLSNVMYSHTHRHAPTHAHTHTTHTHTHTTRTHTHTHKHRW